MTEASAEQPRQTSHFLEFEEKDVRELNPLPDPHNTPHEDESRRLVIPGGVKEYLQNRYGKEIVVDFGSRFGKPDGSGYSYGVWVDGKEISRMTAERTTIHMLPPGYEGPLTKALEEQDTRNALSNSVRNEGLSRVMWRITEQPKATEMRVNQYNTLTRATSEVPWDLQKTKIKPIS